MHPHRLSKTQYLKGRQCIRRVWLYNWHRELMQPPSAVQEAIFQQGHEVGELAHQLFPGGVLIAEDYKNPGGALESTQRALASGATALFEAAFEFDNVLIRTDVVAKNDDGTWSLFEVKSSTKVKDINYPDVALQTYVLKNLGFDVRESYLVHLNNNYVRQGPLDLSSLFTRVALNGHEAFAAAYAEVPMYLKRIRDALAKDEVPEQMLGAICKNPYVCEFKQHCWGDLPRDSIHYLYNIRDKKREALLAMHVDRVPDIPDDFALADTQRAQVQAARLGKPVIDGDMIREHLQKLVYPLWFLDFETYGYAIPQYDGTWSYSRLTFQFSLHVQRAPDAALEHHEFLFEQAVDPRRALAEALRQAIGDNGSVVVYHASFEDGCLRELAEQYPDLAGKLQDIRARVWDLEVPFSKRWYCHPEFYGSSSIKAVLPVLVPRLSYGDLDIGKGDVAQVKYVEMLALPEGTLEREKIKRDLLEYCGQDTMAMVEILHTFFLISHIK